MLAIFSPLSEAHAGTLAMLSGKVKSIFVREHVVEKEELNATSQTMAVFKPVVIDDATTSTIETSKDSDESLRAVSGSLRLSTEDIDFPMTDEISVYEVKQGDTLTEVAKLFNVSVNTIMWANDLKSKTLSQGQTLVILPISGIKYTVKKGDTVTSLAKKYKADAEDIAKFNGILKDSVLAVGGTILIPDGEIEVVVPVKKKTKSSSPVLSVYNKVAGFLVRPVLGGRKTQGLHGHNGVDIGAAPGTPVVASASGRVISAKVGGYNGGYGKMIIIAHDGGVQTVYAHLLDVYVSTGQTVAQGQSIGEVGNTGKSTGPHLHFEVRGAKNPF